MESAPPSSSTISRTAVLILRVLTFVFLLIALVVITVTKETVYVALGVVEVKFNDVYAYRYMLATIVIGFAYNLLQMALSIFNVVSGKRVISGNGGYLLDFYGDKLISYLLATGAAAAFGATQDLKAGGSFHGFFDKANASASVLLLGFLCTAIASIFSSYALPKKA